MKKLLVLVLHATVNVPTAAITQQQEYRYYLQQIRGYICWPDLNLCEVRLEQRGQNNRVAS